ncbi:hypothetical protein GGR52DRAFT_357975 [Hypoxylon sp. FL1284]|nr:hypothetical protein GGR52DRAFT_357975 [Hypoxylon sp. FL1284]
MGQFFFSFGLQVLLWIGRRGRSRLFFFFFRSKARSLLDGPVSYLPAKPHVSLLSYGSNERSPSEIVVHCHHPPLCAVCAYDALNYVLHVTSTRNFSLSLLFGLGRRLVTITENQYRALHVKTTSVDVWVSLVSKPPSRSSYMKSTTPDYGVPRP